MLPNVYENINNVVVKCDIYSRLARERTLFLYEEIDSAVASDMSATLLYLDSIDSSQDITVYINSPGGTVSDGFFTIYDTFRQIRSPIKTICCGEACSAAAFLLACGDHGKRLAYPNVQIMIHNIQAYEISGSKTEIEEEVRQLGNMNRSLLEVFARHTGHPLSKVSKDCDFENYMTAKDALDYGIIDHILIPYKKVPPLIADPSE